MSLFKKLVGQTAIYGLSSVIGRLLNYLLVPLYTRFFLPEEYGVVTELYAYVAFLVVLLTYGLETAFFRFSKTENNQQSVYSTTLISLIFSSSLFVFIMFFSASEISNWMGYGIESRFIKWFAIIVGLDAVSSISFAKLRKEERAWRFASIRLAGILINIILNLYFILYKNLGIEYVFISNLISSITTILFLTPEMIKSKFTFDLVLWKKMIVYALPLLIAGLAGMANETIDRVLLKHFLPNPETASFDIGLYGAFYKLSIIMVLFIQTFRFAAEPFFFSQYKEKGETKVYADVMKYFVIVISIIFLLVTTFYDFFINFLGSSYHDERGFLVVSILLLANFFLGVYYNLSIWFKLTEKTIYGAYIAIFGAAITIILNYSLIPIIGFIGCAIATLACYLLMTVASFYLGNKHFPVPYNYSRISMYFLLMVCIYLILYYTNFTTIFDSLFILGYMIIIYFIERPKFKESKPQKLF